MGANAALYNQHCSACHVTELSDDHKFALALDDFRHGTADTAIANVIAEGRGQMPGFEHILSPDEIRSLVLYLREKQFLAERESLTPPQDLSDHIFVSRLEKFKLRPVAETDTGVFWSINFLPDGSLLAPEKSGRLWLISKDGSKTEVQGTPQGIEGYDSGLMDVVAHPDYSDNGWIYLSYSAGTHLGTANSPVGKIPINQGSTRLVRGRIRDGKWVDQQTLFAFRAEHSELLKTRFGTKILLKDSYVYFSVGDGGKGELSQALNVPSGKIFRLTEDGKIPPDNPFVDVEGAYPEIWTFGNRNVQGMSVQPETGLLFASEHGPRGGDELNIIHRGNNYGWPLITFGIDYDGSAVSSETSGPGMEQPLHYWTPSISPGGIDFYKGQLFPNWNGDLFVSGMGAQQLRRVRIRDDAVVEDEILVEGIGRIRDVVNGPSGSLYIVVNQRAPDAGHIYELIPATNAD